MAETRSLVVMDIFFITNAMLLFMIHMTNGQNSLTVPIFKGTPGDIILPCVLNDDLSQIPYDPSLQIRWNLLNGSVSSAILLYVNSTGTITIASAYQQIFTFITSTFSLNGSVSRFEQDCSLKYECTASTNYLSEVSLNCLDIFGLAQLDGINITNGSNPEHKLPKASDKALVTFENISAGCPSSYTLTLTRKNRVITINSDCTAVIKATDVRESTNVTITVYGSSIVFTIRSDNRLGLGLVLSALFVCLVAFVIGIYLIIRMCKCSCCKWSDGQNMFTNKFLMKLFIPYIVLALIVFVLCIVALLLCHHFDFVIGVAVVLIVIMLIEVLVVIFGSVISRNQGVDNTGPSSQPVKLKVSEVTATTAMVSWVSNVADGWAQTFTLCHNELLNGHVIQSKGISDPGAGESVNYTIRNLKENTKYSVKVHTINANSGDVVVKSDVKTFTTKGKAQPTVSPTTGNKPHTGTSSL